MVKSLWTDSVRLPRFGVLQGDAKIDVLIVGGGMCGILCAYLLKQAGVDYMLVEADTIGMGITKNTTAKITSQHGLIYDKLIKSKGMEKAKMYLQANEAALKKYAELAKNIHCDFEEQDAYTYSLSDRKKIEDEVKAVNSLGLPAEFVENPNLPFQTKGAIKFPRQAQFNPLKFMAEIAKDLNIFEHTAVNDISSRMVWTERGKITADKIIVATHFPFIDRHGSYYLKMYQSRSYVIALENAPDLRGMYVDEAQNGMSFRNYRDLLLLGGGGSRTGKENGNWQELRDFQSKYYPHSREKYFWATQDCISLDNVPYIGQYSKNTPNLYTATGFNKWGMTSSMAAAMILSNMVTGKANSCQPVFSPQRNMLTTQLFINIFESTVNLLTPTLKRCPHLGCALKWNKAERSWDCPCHGSRFEKNGDLIDNPANGNAKVR